MGQQLPGGNTFVQCSEGRGAHFIPPHREFFPSDEIKMNILKKNKKS